MSASVCHYVIFRLTQFSVFMHKAIKNFPTIQLTITLQILKQKHAALLPNRVIRCDQKQKTNSGLNRISAVTQQ